jgi:glucose/arabinose dehydrogenase/plastocyanin
MHLEFLSNYGQLSAMKTVLLLLSMLACTDPLLAEPLVLQPNDEILLYGNSFAERLQEEGSFEAYLQLAYPNHMLTCRSLAWTGDEVGHRLRPEGYPAHLNKLLAVWPAQHVLVAMGMNESFHGARGLKDFKEDLTRYLQELKRRHPDARVTCLSIIACEPNSFANAGIRNSDIQLYNRVLQAVAEANQAGYVDLFMPSQRLYKNAKTLLTVDGQHLSSEGYRQLAPILAQALLDTEAMATIDPARVPEVAQAVAVKHGYNATLTRPINAVIYYGVRARASEYNAEMPRYHALLGKADEVIHQRVQHPESRLAQYLPITLKPMEAGQPRDAQKGAGQIFTPAEQEKTLKVAEGYALNLFASETDFPEMKNPIQIAFDHRGRLWVVTMPSFPHTVPGEQPADKIIILEDTDHDGKADRCTTFADGLNVPDGLAFYRDGVIISAQPRLIFMKDTDGDDVADVQEELLRGIDVTDAHHGGMITLSPIGDVMFCDGVFHRSQLETPMGVTRGVDASTYRFNPTRRSVEREYQTLTPNPWKITFDRWGNLHHMYGDGYVQDSHAVPWTPFGIYHPFGRSITIKYGKGSGACAISSQNFPDAYQDGMASATLVGSYFVALSKMSAEDGPFKATDRLDVVSSSNAAFRPVDMAFGFDGAMYISDFCSPIIGHAQHPMRDSQWDHEHGRIWRVIHTEKPLVTDWPKLEGASPDTLLQLLQHPQDLIREHARNQLRLVDDLEERLDAYASTLDPMNPVQRQAMLECLRLFVEHGHVRTKLFNSLLTCDDPLTRAGAIHLLRFQSNQGMTSAWLQDAAKDPHPRVRLQLITTLSHLQTRKLEWAALLGRVKVKDSPALQQVLADASHGVDDARGPEVPILEKPSGARIDHWLMENKDGFVHYDETSKEKPKGKGLQLRSWLNTTQAQRAILSVKTGYVTVHVNGLPVLNAATFWSSDWNVQIELQEGLNEIEVHFGDDQRARGPAPVYLYTTQGQLIADTVHAFDDASLRKMQVAYQKQQGIHEGEIRISAVPNQLAFSPRTFRVQAGQEVSLIFSNPDLAMHNLVIMKPGTEEAVGLLADKLALDPDAMARQYVPESQYILWASKLLKFKDTEKMVFTAPAEKGRHPFLCTFPGHWRVMKGEMIVE